MRRTIKHVIQSTHRRGAFPVVIFDDERLFTYALLPTGNTRVLLRVVHMELKEASDENYNRYLRRSFPLRYFGSGRVREVIRAWAPCERNSRGRV